MKRKNLGIYFSFFKKNYINTPHTFFQTAKLLTWHDTPPPIFFFSLFVQNSSSHTTTTTLSPLSLSLPRIHTLAYHQKHTHHSILSFSLGSHKKQTKKKKTQGSRGRKLLLKELLLPSSSSNSLRKDCKILSCLFSISNMNGMHHVVFFSVDTYRIWMKLGPW